MAFVCENLGFFHGLVPAPGRVEASSSAPLFAHTQPGPVLRPGVFGSPLPRHGEAASG